MKPTTRILVPIFVLLTTLFGNALKAADQAFDPCDEVIERACSSKYLEDPTGGSSGGNVPPPVYTTVKRDFARSLSDQLSKLTQTAEWNEISSWVLAKINIFQNQETAKVAAALCSDLRSKTECNTKLVALLTHELSVNLFFSTDLLYRKETTQIATADTTRTAHGPISKYLSDTVKMGESVRLLNVSELQNAFPSIKAIYLQLRTHVQQGLLFDSQRTESIRAKIWADSKSYLAQLVEQFDAKSTSRHFNYLTLRNSALDSKSILDDYLLLMSPNAQYVAYDREVVVENGILLSNTSYFGNFFLLSHELAHPIDPCFLGRPIEGQFWYPGLIKFLRKEVGIKDRSTAYLKTNPISNYACSNEDEIGEAAADAIATEVFSMMLEKKWTSLSQTHRITAVAQALRPFRCDEFRPIGDTHLSTVDRYQKIILANPRIRKFLGCKKL